MRWETSNQSECRVRDGYYGCSRRLVDTEALEVCSQPKIGEPQSPYIGLQHGASLPNPAFGTPSCSNQAKRLMLRSPTVLIASRNLRIQRRVIEAVPQSHDIILIYIFNNFLSFIRIVVLII